MNDITLDDSSFTVKHYRSAHLLKPLPNEG